LSSSPSLPDNPTRHIHLDPSRHDGRDTWSSPNVLRIMSRYAGHEVRVGIGYVGPAGQCRREHGGPVLPGPYAYLFPLPTVIAADGGTSAESAQLRTDGTEWDATEGDELLIGGQRYRIQDDHSPIPAHYPRLIHLGTAPSRHADHTLPEDQPEAPTEPASPAALAPETPALPASLPPRQSQPAAQLDIVAGQSTPDGHGTGPVSPTASWDALGFFLIVTDSPTRRRAYGPFSTSEQALACYTSNRPTLGTDQRRTRLFALCPPLDLSTGTPEPLSTPPAAPQAAAAPARGGFVLLIERPSTGDALLIGAFRSRATAHSWWHSQRPAFPGAHAQPLPILPPPATGSRPAHVPTRPHHRNDGPRAEGTL
jgi:hypothetical protein